MEQVQRGHHRSAASLLGRLIWPPSLAEAFPALWTHLLPAKAKLLRRCKTASFTAPSPPAWAAGEGSILADTHWELRPQTPWAHAWQWDHRRVGGVGKHQPHQALKLPGLGIAPPAFPAMTFPPFPSPGRMDVRGDPSPWHRLTATQQAGAGRGAARTCFTL